MQYDIPKKKKVSRFSIVFTCIATIVFAIFVRWLIHSYLFLPLYISTNAMEPSLAKGKRIYIKRYFDPSTLKRGSLIFFSHPKTDKYKLIRRIVALPGEKISLVKGNLYINGKAVKVLSLNKKKNIFGTIHNSEIKLKANEFFVLGDNLSMAIDSRYLGPISFEQIEGVYK